MARKAATTKKITTKYEVTVTGGQDIDAPDVDTPWTYDLVAITEVEVRDGRGVRYEDADRTRRVLAEDLDPDQLAGLIASAAEHLSWGASEFNRHLRRDAARKEQQ